MSKPIPQDYWRLLGKIKERIRTAQYEALRKFSVASYRIVSTLPEEVRGQLPAPAQVSKLLEDL